MDLHEFYESIDLEKLDYFIKSKKEENLNIEFKTFSKNPFTKDDKKNFAKALSGFANSSGGIIIWGIVAKGNSNSPDVATSKQPIEDLAKSISLLNSFTGEFVSPIVDGVEHKLIEPENSENRGFIVTLIPQSDNGPHRAEGGLGQYYKRSGDSFYPLEHYDLEDMFGRRPHPKLELIIEDSSNPAYPFEQRVGIKNTGKGIAKFPYLYIHLSYPFIIGKNELDGKGRSGLPRIITSELKAAERKYGGSSEIVVYPQNLLWVTIVRPEPRNDTHPKLELTIDYIIHCEGYKGIKDTLSKMIIR